MTKHPMYMVGLTVAAFIGWKLMAEAAERFEDALAHPTDDDNAVDAI